MTLELSLDFMFQGVGWTAAIQDQESTSGKDLRNCCKQRVKLIPGSMPLMWVCYKVCFSCVRSSLSSLVTRNSSCGIREWFAVCPMPQLPLGFPVPFINEVVRFGGWDFKRKNEEKKENQEGNGKGRRRDMVAVRSGSCGLSWFWKSPLW